MDEMRYNKWLLELCNQEYKGNIKEVCENVAN
jgi:hypothetical protein